MFFPHQIFRKVHVVAIPHSAKYSTPDSKAKSSAYAMQPEYISPIWHP